MVGFNSLHALFFHSIYPLPREETRLRAKGPYLKISIISPLLDDKAISTRVRVVGNSGRGQRIADTRASIPTSMSHTSDVIRVIIIMVVLNMNGSGMTR